MNKRQVSRIDSSKGYIKGNIQLVELCVNRFKSNLPESIFLNLVSQIYHYQYKTYTPKQFDIKQATKHIKHLLKTCKNSIKSREKQDRNKKCLEFDLTVEFILELIIKQGNRCAYTGKELLWFIKNNYTASIDRIDSNKGYTKDNVQLVLKFVNQSKSNLTHGEFLNMVNQIYNK